MGKISSKESNMFIDFTSIVKSIIKFFTSEKFIFSCIIIILIILAIHIVKKFVNQLVKSEHIDTSGNLIIFIRDGLKIAIITVGALIILDIYGINTTSMVAGLGIASTVVAFSLQDALKDIIMGFKILYDNFFKVGDVVQIGTYTGIITDFNIRETEMKSIYDDSVIKICNRDISDVVHVSNWFDIDVPLSYEENLEKINTVMTSTADKIKNLPEIIDSQYLGTQDFLDSSITYKIRIYCKPKDRLIQRRAAIQQIQKELNLNNISIPYNQLDVHQKP